MIDALTGLVLMFVLWYCHKRGREVRLEKEKVDAEGEVDGSSRVEELPDDPQLQGPETTRLITTGADPDLAEASSPADRDAPSNSARR